MVRVSNLFLFLTTYLANSNGVIPRALAFLVNAPFLLIAFCIHLPFDLEDRRFVFVAICGITSRLFRLSVNRRQHE